MCAKEIACTRVYFLGIESARAHKSCLCFEVDRSDAASRASTVEAKSTVLYIPQQTCSAHLQRLFCRLPHLLTVRMSSFRLHSTTGTLAQSDTSWAVRHFAPTVPEADQTLTSGQNTLGISMVSQQANAIKQASVESAIEASEPLHRPGPPSGASGIDTMPSGSLTLEVSHSEHSLAQTYSSASKDVIHISSNTDGMTRTTRNDGATSASSIGDRGMHEKDSDKASVVDYDHSIGNTAAVSRLEGTSSLIDSQGFWLVGINGAASGRAIPVTCRAHSSETSALKIGRAPSCHLSVSDVEVSGQHALVWWDAQNVGLMVADRPGSFNGTFLRLASEKETSSPYPLQAGDTAVIGDFALVLESIEVPDQASQSSECTLEMPDQASQSSECAPSTHTVESSVGAGDAAPVSHPDGFNDSAIAENRQESTAQRDESDGLSRTQELSTYASTH